MKKFFLFCFIFFTVSVFSNDNMDIDSFFDQKSEDIEKSRDKTDPKLDLIRRLNAQVIYQQKLIKLLNDKIIELEHQKNIDYFREKYDIGFLRSSSSTWFYNCKVIQVLSYDKVLVTQYDGKVALLVGSCISGIVDDDSLLITGKIIGNYSYETTLGSKSTVIAIYCINIMPEPGVINCSDKSENPYGHYILRNIRKF